MEPTDESLRKFFLSLATIWPKNKDIELLRSAAMKGARFDWDIGWRSVEQDLPRMRAAGYSEAVLTVVVSIAGRKSICLDRYDWEGACWEILHHNSGVDTDTVTHWMPLPEVAGAESFNSRH